MNEIIVITRDQYFKDLQDVAAKAAEIALNKFISDKKPLTVTRAEASRLIGKSKATIKIMIDQQRIRTTSDGSCIPYSEIDRFLNVSK